MMLQISPVLVLVFAVTIPISLLFTRYMTKKVRPLFRHHALKLRLTPRDVSSQGPKAYNEGGDRAFRKHNNEAVDAPSRLLRRWPDRPPTLNNIPLAMIAYSAHYLSFQRISWQHICLSCSEVRYITGLPISLPNQSAFAWPVGLNLSTRNPNRLTRRMQ